MCLDGKELDHILNICCIIAVHFPRNAIYFIILPSVQIILRSVINHVLKFKYRLSRLKAKPHGQPGVSF